MAQKTWIGPTGSTSWATSGSWSPAGAPATGDTVYFLTGDSTIDSGLAQSGVTLAARYIGPNWTGSIGSSSTPLAISITQDVIDFSQGTLLNTDYGSNAATVTVLNSQQGTADDGLEWIRMKGTNITLYTSGGITGVGTAAPGDTATLTALSMTPSTQAVLTPQVDIAPGVTVTTVLQQTGAIFCAAACPILNQTGGTFTHLGSGALGATSLTVGGTVYPNSTGNLTGTNIILGTGILDFSSFAAPRSVANVISMYSGAQLNADKTYITLTGGFTAVECLLSDLKVNVGFNRHFVVS